MSEGSDYVTDISVVRRIAQFVLNRNTDNMRRELHEFLVGMALLSPAEFQTLNLSEILDQIRDLFQLPDFPEKPTRAAIESMVKRGDVSSQEIRGEQRYILTPEARLRFGVVEADYSEIRDRVENEITERAKRKMKRISRSKQSMLMKCLDLTFGRILEMTSRMAATANTGMESRFMTTLNEPGVSDQIHAAVCNYFRGEAREKIALVLMEYVASPTDALAAYMHTTSLSYYIVQVLHLDPECQHMTKSEFSQKRFYLDTNVVIELLAGRKRQKEAIRRLLEISTSLGMKPLVTTRTKEEFLSVTDRNKAVLRASPIPIERYEKVKDLVEDGFLKDYMEKKGENPGLTVEGYFGRLELFEEVLLKWGVMLDDVDFEEVKSHSSFDDLKGKIIELRPGKSDSVAEHDALHILFVKMTRDQEEPGITGPRTWFLTFDLSLPDADRILLERGRVQSCVNPDQWMQMLTPMLTADTSKKEVPHLYATLFTTSLPAAASLIRAEDLLKIQGPWMDDEDLGEREIRMIVSSAYAQSYLRETPYKDLSPEGLEKALEPIVEEIKELKALEIEREKGIAQAKRMLFGLYILAALVLDIIVYIFAPIQLLTGVVAAEIAIVMILREEVRDILGLGSRRSSSH